MQEEFSRNETNEPYASPAMAEDAWKGVAEKIKATLRERGDQKRLALRSGVSDSSLSRYLKCQQVPDVNDLFALSRALDVPV